MQLGDFFATAPYARPVNPKPVKFTAVARGKGHLPGGHPNPHGRPVAATVTGAFVFLGGDGAQECRMASKKSLRERFPDLMAEPDDLAVELTYQILQRVLYEWDEENRKIGERLFASVDLLREHVEVREANRVLTEYNKYVDDEHPEVLEDKPFRGPTKGSPRVVANASGRQVAG